MCLSDINQSHARVTSASRSGTSAPAAALHSRCWMDMDIQSINIIDSNRPNLRSQDPSHKYIHYLLAGVDYWCCYLVKSLMVSTDP